MTATAITSTAIPAPASADQPGVDEQRLRWHSLLRNTCTHLGMAPADTDRILAEEALQVDGVDIALRLNPQVQQGEFYADCGAPESWQEADVYRQILEEALSNDMPALSIALHRQSHHLVAKASVALPAVDDEGWLCTAMLLATVARTQELRQKFTLKLLGDK